MHLRGLPIATALLAAFSLGSPHAEAGFTMYVAEAGNNDILKFDQTGARSTFATGVSGAGALAVDSAGNVYVAERTASPTIHEYSSTGQDLGTFASTGLFRPSALAFGSDGTLYVANESTNGTVGHYSASGQFLGLFATTGMDHPEGLAFDSHGNLYAANNSGNSVREFSATGHDLGNFATGSGPSPLTFDAAGNLYVGLQGAYGSPLNVIEKFSGTGTDLGSFASTGVNGPAGLAFAPTGDLFLTNASGGSVRRFSSTGQDLGDFASGLSFPIGVAIAQTRAVPEPASLAMLGIGLLGIAARRRARAGRAS